MPDFLIPRRSAIARALLELLSDGRVYEDAEICESLIQRFGIDEAQLPVIKKTRRPKFRNEIDWVKVDLGEKGEMGKGMIRQVRERHYQITSRGLAALQGD